MLQTLSLLALMLGLTMAPPKQQVIHVTQVDTAKATAKVLVAYRVDGGFDLRAEAPTGTKKRRGKKRGKARGKLLMTLRTGPTPDLWQARPGGRAEPIPLRLRRPKAKVKPFASAPRQSIQTSKGTIVLQLSGKQLAVFPKGEPVAYLLR